MSVNEMLSRPKRSARSRALPGKWLVGAVLIGFLLLHIVGVSILRRDAAADGSTRQETSSQRYD